MHNLYEVRSIRPTRQPSEMRSAKMIELRVRRQADRAQLEAPRATRPYAV